MIPNKENLLNQKYDEYLFFMHGKDYYHAIQLLGEIYNCLSLLSNPKQKEWLNKLHNETISEIAIKKIESEVTNDIRMLKRLISAKNSFLFEEMVLILTRRIQVDLVLFVLREIGIDEMSTNKKDLADLDEEINIISKMQRNKEEFNYAIKSIKKNWGIPIINKWLDADISKKRNH